MSIQNCFEPSCISKTGAIELVVESQAKDLGGFSVSWLLPSEMRQTVGPFIFFDHIGPATFAPGSGVNVRPHPHIGLATVTYLFEGELTHRDSLGFVQAIQPGAVNWMSAGRGIVHSERTPEALRDEGSRLHGIQSWISLPVVAEETDPDFSHYPSEVLPTIELPGVSMSLIAGSAFGDRSPVVTASPMFYLAAEMDAGSEFVMPDEYEERAVYIVKGSLVVDGEGFSTGQLIVFQRDRRITIVCEDNARLMLLGGAAIDGPRYLWWNLVSHSRERIEKAKADWKNGRFDKVPGETEFIPLPEDRAKKQRIDRGKR